jgi:glycerophosphoryl diester phosphodiesterase
MKRPSRESAVDLELYEKVKVIAHRGSSKAAPENTLEAVRLTRFDGADMIEGDVHLTKDLHCVIIHDSTVDRTTDGKGRVEDFTLNELLKLNANNGK